MKEISKTTKLGGRDFTITYGKLAMQADAGVIAKYGDTVVLAAVTSKEMQEDRGYFPLSVDYQERLYAGGRIKGSRWVKREGRPTDDEILTSRFIDRSIRPLFKDSEGYKKEVQVIVTVLSVDMKNDSRIVAANAVSAALAASRIPWDGPVAVTNVGLEDGKFVTNPLIDSEKDAPELELIVSNTKDAIVMIDSAALEVPEEQIMDGIGHAEKESKALIKFIEDFAKEVGNEKEAFEKQEAPKELVANIKKEVEPKLPELVKKMAKPLERGMDDFFELVDSLKEPLEEEEQEFVGAIVDKITKAYIRDLIIKGDRPDGRKHTEVRKITSEVGLLPNTHGSAVFNRGETQVLNVATLGSPQMGQLIESVLGEEDKLYMHHYVFPPYSTGETGRVGSPGRREIGHGALAEKALEPVLPTLSEFPYAIRLVSEVTSSNGSTSMASTCASTLSLMDAGVPIKSPVSGIAMGLIIDGKKTAVLSDLAAIEDFNGDMDFKVTGTEKGVTALQLDVKTLALTLPILRKAMAQAAEGRAHILAEMLKTIKKPNAEVSVHAPKIKTITIPEDKIGEIIGPGGKTIKGMIAKYDAQINVDDDGTVSVSGVNGEGVDAAIETIENMTKEVLPGELYEGEVVRIENFGAFINILPGRDGMVHVSDMSKDFVKDPNDIVKMGQQVHVRVKEVDRMGRINLSMMLDPAADAEKEERKDRDGGGRGGDRGGRGGSRGGHGGGQSGGSSRGGGRGGSRGDDKKYDNRSKGGKRDREGGGPHFPTSRLVDTGGSKYRR